MPPKNNSKHPKQQGRPRPRRSRGPSSALFTYQPPQSRRVRLVWAGASAITESSASNGAQRVYRLNGAYDVDTTVGSTSTPGFAEYSQFFTSYRVWSAAVKLHFSASGASVGTPVIVGMYPNATNVYLTAPPFWLTAPMSVNSTITGDGSGGRSVAIITKRFDLPKIARITPQQYRTDMDYSAAVTSVPVRQLQLAVFGAGIESSSVTTIRYTIWVSMEIEFFNPVMLSS